MKPKIETLTEGAGVTTDAEFLKALLPLLSRR